MMDFIVVQRVGFQSFRPASPPSRRLWPLLSFFAFFALLFSFGLGLLFFLHVDQDAGAEEKKNEEEKKEMTQKQPQHF